MNFRKRDYVVFFVLLLGLFTINFYGTPSIIEVVGIIVTSMIASLILGTITNLVSEFVKRISKS